MITNEKPKRRWLKRTLLGLAIAIPVGIAALLWLGAPEPTPCRPSGEHMQAVVYHEYGTADVLRLEQVERCEPGDNQVLLEVRAAAANPLDWHYMRGTPYLMRLSSGLRKPVDPGIGVDVSGVVAAIGKSVTRFKVGDEVFGVAPGSFAQYAVASEKRLVPKPAGLSFEQAASVPVAALTALQGLRDIAKIRPGQKVLINGASGGVGTFAVQIAKSYGAEVTGVCSTRNVELVRSLGADHVIDYKKEDFTQGGQRYDVILDNVGNQPLSGFTRVLQPDGILVLVGGGGPSEGNWIGPLARPVKALLMSPFVKPAMVMFISKSSPEDLALLTQLMLSGKVRPVIDRTYPLSQAPDAIRYLEAGRARGKVIIKVGPDPEV